MLENTGTITGNVFIGTSGAFVTKAGVMGGELTLSFLSDVCFAAGNGLVAGIISGGEGNASADLLNGGSGNDCVFGAADDDTITGGGGRDVLCGNSGADTFICEAVSVSPLAEADRIRDFESNIDKIDLSALESFTFIGSNAFSGTNTGAEVRFQTTFAGLRFEMDVDGDGVIDMRVNMNGVSTMTADDFIL